MIKPTVLYSTLIVLCFLAGILFFFFQRQFIVVHFDWGKAQACEDNQLKKNILRRGVHYHYWKDGTWKSEPETIIWYADNATENLKNMVKNWLSFLQDEGICDQTIKLETIALSSFDEELFLSFNHSLFSKNWSIVQKWFIIEGLFKTIRATNIPLRTVHFLVGEQILQDDHLDFSQKWSIDGFLTQE